MAETAIEWATHVWNPVTGCDRVSPGCANCYALTYAGRLKAMGQAKYQRDGGRASGPGFGLTLHRDELNAPLRWMKPRRIFVNSMSDLFHEEVPDSFIDEVLWTIGITQRHNYLVLTKRPERMRDYFANRRYRNLGYSPQERGYVYFPIIPGEQRADDGPLPNLWLGVSIENRRFVHRAEPLLGPLLADYVELDGVTPTSGLTHWDDGYRGPQLDLASIDWLIVGGESGHGARRMDPEWVRDLRDACTLELARRAREDLPGRGGPAFFFKQWGGRTPKAGGRELDGRTWDELPAAARATEVVA